MKTKLMLLLAAGGAALLFAADQPRKEPSELDKLKAKVVMLEGRIDQLEARIASLARAKPAAFAPFDESAPLLQQKREDLVPPNIGEIEVNGLKVYKVPLSSIK